LKDSFARTLGGSTAAPADAHGPSTGHGDAKG